MNGHALRARRALVALLSLLLAFGSTPAQLWASGIDGIAQAIGADVDASAPAGPDGEGDAGADGAPGPDAEGSGDAIPALGDVPAEDGQAVPGTGAAEAAQTSGTDAADAGALETSASDGGVVSDVASVSSAAAEPAADAATAPQPDSDAAAPSAEDEARLAQAVEALKNDGFSGYRPNPHFGTDTNLNDMIEARLAELGHPGVQSHVSAGGHKAADSRDPKMAGDIDVSAGASNGDITYFFLAPEDKTVPTDYGVLRQFQPTYRLSLGAASVEYTPGRTFSLPWDDDAVKACLERAAADAAMPEVLTRGSAAEEVKTVELPSQLKRGQASTKAIEISWESSNRSAAKIEQGFDSSYNPLTKVTFTHGATPATATLTATFKLFVSGYGNAPTATYARNFAVSVAPRSAATQAEIEKALKGQINRVSVADAETGAAIKADALDADVQLSRPRDLGLDGKYYKLSYTSSNDRVLRVNGYRGVVTRRLEGEAPASATLTAHLTYNGVSVEREVGTYTPTTVTNEEIDRAVAFMAQVKDAYGTALLAPGDTPDAVTGDLRPFSSASEGKDGSIAWAATAADADGTGIVPVDLPGYDPMASQPWRTFRSSREDVVSSETLRVKQPVYNTRVTIDSSLTYKRYESLARAHRDDARLAQLIEQPVSATYMVRGTTGQPNPDAGRMLTVSVKVTGITPKDPDGSYRPQDWIPLTEVEVPADAGAMAWDVLRGALDAAGYTYTVNAAGPLSIATPDGRTLDSDFNEPYRYWAFYVDGAYGQGDEGAATTCPVRDGMTVELRYVDGSGQEKPQGSVAVNPDADHPDVGADWHGFANGGFGSLSSAAAPLPGKAEEAWNLGLLTPEEQQAGASLSASDPVLAGGKVYLVTGSTAYGPAPTFTPTRSLARLQVINQATGAIEREVALGASMDSTCRPVYADGIIVIPLAGGAVQAVSAATCETLWFVPAVGTGQALCTLTVHDGYVYVAGFGELGDDGLAASGGIVRYNLYTGARSGAVADDATGYYWAGGVMVGDYYVIGDDAGTLHVFTSDLSREISSVALSGGPLRSTLTVADGLVYAVSRDAGTLHQVRIESDGTARETASVAFAAYSTSSPTICGGYAFIGGATGAGWGAGGVLAVVDLSTMRVQRITHADGAVLPGEVKGTPLVVSDGRAARVYFTCNGAMGMYPDYTAGGGIYVLELGDDEASVLFQPGPGLANYCIASIACDAQGNLYYTNDSGHLFKVSARRAGGGGSGSEEIPVPDPEEEQHETEHETQHEADVPGGGAVAGAGAVKQGTGASVAKAAAPSEAALPGESVALLAESGERGDARDSGAKRARATVGDSPAAGRLSWWAIGGAGVSAVVLLVCIAYVLRVRRR